MLYVAFGSFSRVVCRLVMVAMRHMGVVGSLFMISRLVVLGSFPVMSGCMFMVLGSFVMVLSSFLCHFTS